MKPDNGYMVAWEKNICPACGEEFETKSILIIQNLNKLFQEKYITTGFSLCEDCINIAIENNGIWFCEITKTKENIRTGRSFLMKMKVLDNAEEGHKKFAKENHWIAIDKETANNFENTLMGDKNGTNQIQRIHL